MKNFADELVKRIEELDNPTVMGLDPRLDYVPQEIQTKWMMEYPTNNDKATAEAIYEFNCGLIESVCDMVPAVKLQIAYYEMYGVRGIEVFKRTIDYARAHGMLVIADAKRNDIGSTAQAYAEALIGKTLLNDGVEEVKFGADAVTVNGYLGIDGVKPFIDVCKRDGRGIFTLVRTSNPSAADLQDLELKDGRTVYQAMADSVNDWGKELIGESGFSSIGAVVGATVPQQAVEARKRMPNALILVPGYGAQGAGPDAAVASFTKDGRGSIVNASRSLMCAWKNSTEFKPKQFMKATRQEAISMKTLLGVALQNRKYV